MLLDDIATLLDDVAVLSKVAAKKTAGVLGDDLALNAQQVAGVHAQRELPVVWAVAKGSLVNKAILVPLAVGLSAVAPWAILPLLMAGGLYLAFEGFEKLVHAVMPHHDEAEAAHERALLQAAQDGSLDVMALERDKVKGAIRTDFILSTEIIVITLGTVAGASLGTRLGVLAGVAVLLTVGVYGLVAVIVKLDDVGLWLCRRHPAGPLGLLGRTMVRAAPWLMRSLTVLGTAAMFLVGGGILLHGWPALGHALEAWAAATGDLMAPAIGLILNLIAGVMAGALAYAVMTALLGLRKTLKNR